MWKDFTTHKISPQKKTIIYIHIHIQVVCRAVIHSVVRFLLKMRHKINYAFFTDGSASLCTINLKQYLKWQFLNYFPVNFAYFPQLAFIPESENPEMTSALLTINYTVLSFLTSIKNHDTSAYLSTIILNGTTTFYSKLNEKPLQGSKLSYDSLSKEKKRDAKVYFNISDRGQ